MKPWGYIAIVLLFALGVGALYRKLMSKFAWPVEGRITSKFGPRTHPITGKQSLHNGVDIAAPIGTPVYAPADGTVISLYNTTTGGKQMVLQHKGNVKTGYAHLNAFKANMGDQVRRGDVIAEVGNTGASTGPHLHFTVTDGGGRKVDPETYLA
jgi:murein DD-endopeptidase MepM/ murein hydrolase activator NlpD